jgi:hypothetical protein
MITSFYGFHVWGMDWGHLQLRARWFVGPRLIFAKDQWCWYIFAGPFELSGHVPR